MFVAIVTNSDKKNYVYSGYGITFDSAGSWSFDNHTARNVIIFGVDNSLLSHSDNHKNILLVLSQGPTFSITIMEALVHQRKSLVLILVKKNKILCEFTL